VSAVNTFPLEGGCDCRAVRYRLESAPLVVNCCHCRWCQRESGAAFALNAMIESDRVTNLGIEPEVVHTPSESGAGQKIARCPRCRVAVWSHYAGAGRITKFVRVGTLDTPDALPPDVHIFIASKQPWVVLPPGAKVFAEYYEREHVWSPDALARRQALLPRIEAYQAALPGSWSAIETAPITDADPTVEEMQRRVARFAALTPTDDYIDAAIPGCERTTWRVIGEPGVAPIDAQHFHMNLVRCEPGRSAPLHNHLTQEVFVALSRALAGVLGAARFTLADARTVGHDRHPARRLARLSQRRRRAGDAAGHRGWARAGDDQLAAGGTRRSARSGRGAAFVSEPVLRQASGFTFQRRKNGVVEVFHHGRLASTLRGHDAEDFAAEIASCSEVEAQQVMARITGNYKRGNERTASEHPRNRR
jgi:hypothetical protein